MYPHDVQLFIDGQWVGGSDRAQVPIVNPATGKVIVTILGIKIPVENAVDVPH